MSKLRDGCLCVLLLALTGLTVYLIDTIAYARAALDQLPAQVLAAVHSEAEATRAAALNAIAETRREALAEVHGQLDATRASLLVRVDTAGAALPVAVEHALAPAVADLDRIAATAEDARPLLQSSASITKQVDEALPLYLDCDAGNCLYNHIQGTARATDKALTAVQRSAEAFEKTAPAVAENVAQITANTSVATASVASIARSWEKQTPIYIRVLGWAGSAATKIKALFSLL